MPDTQAPTSTITKKPSGKSGAAAKPTACILCAQNCGVTVQVNEQQQITRVLGDEKHPVSQGYLCQKASRLTYYQDQARLTSPLKRQSDGSFAEISWDQAIKEIADKLVAIRDTHGGKTIAYAGGGGQGNHLGGVFGSATRAACDTPFFYSALAQEKTGNFWVHGKLFGKQNTNFSEAVAEADYILVIGANPMQSHGFAKARSAILDIAKNPRRTLVVVDPRVSETAKKADIHMAVKPGKDAFLFAAMLGVLVQEKLCDSDFLAKHTVGYERLQGHFEKVPVDEYAAIAGVDATAVRQVARDMAKAKTVGVRSDLGIEQSHNSTLNAYLMRLLFLLTGNFGKHGTNCLHTAFMPLIGHSPERDEGGPKTAITGMHGICKLFPPNVLPLEIDSDHPGRTRALIVESANPLNSYPDIEAQRKAYAKLDLMVVIDVAMTETAQAAHYVLPAASQYEKFESTFFNLEFPENYYHLRHPVAEPLANTRPEPDIHHDLVCAMGELPKKFPLLKALVKLDRKLPQLRLLPMALGVTFKLHPKWAKYASLVLKATLGEVLAEKRAKTGAAPLGNYDVASVLWFASHAYAKKYAKQVRRAGLTSSGYMLGEELFNKVINSPSGLILSRHTHDEHWELMRHPDKKVHLYIAEMCEWLDMLPQKAQRDAERDKAYPFNLMAGERRSYNANTILRNPEWRKKDKSGALKMNPSDAARLGIANGDWVNCRSNRGAIKLQVQLTVEMPDKVVSMPHGYGLRYPGANNSEETIGAQANLLSDLKDCDPLAKTPYHKNIAVNIEPLAKSA
ncbi:MAG: molybdopterin-dependent oxidoreductase [Gammaproteobacteria bacterium]|nr:molybdopterin-dependent oxidoreductase [Gammaproteobacteria bacterium]MBT8150008.1 molybdopterin-dependent oxidoreductase [Gammaproteobacteria bacterium]NND40136.1 molybdopterin-dependent oxidoreductase [Pseudomonadales bacterium]